MKKLIINLKYKIHNINIDILYWIFWLTIPPIVIIIGLYYLAKEGAKIRCVHYHEEEYYETTRIYGGKYITEKKTRTVCDKYEKRD